MVTLPRVLPEQPRQLAKQVNNKWVVPKRVLERNAASIINAPEFDIDFSVEYDLTYSADVIEVLLFFFITLEPKVE